MWAQMRIDNPSSINFTYGLRRIWLADVMIAFLLKIHTWDAKSLLYDRRYDASKKEPPAMMTATRNHGISARSTKERLFESMFFAPGQGRYWG